MNFYKPINLPKLMVAPNGSKRMKIDHESIPITISEICSTAKACYNSEKKDWIQLQKVSKLHY